MAKMAPMEYLWKDRKRILGMPITFTKYSLSEDRIFLQTGLLNVRMEEIVLYRVRDISMSVKLTQRIFGVGSIRLYSSDKSMPELDIKNVKRPWEVKELIHRQVEEMKIRRRMRVNEVLSDGGAADDALEDDLLD